MKSVTYRKDVSVVTLTPTQRHGQYIFWEHVFGVLTERRVEALLTVTAEYRMAIVMKSADAVEEVREALAGVCHAEIGHGKALLCAVGENIAGIGLFLENFTLALSPYPKHIPMLLGNVTWNLQGLSGSSIQIVIISLSLALIVLLDYIVHRTPIGMAMRAISWDKTFVPLMGIPVDLIISITFAIGAGLAGAAGTLYALAYPVIDPYMGILVGWKAIICAVVGGIGNIRGAMAGAFILGGVEIMVVAFLPSTYRDFIAFTLLML